MRPLFLLLLGSAYVNQWKQLVMETMTEENNQSHHYFSQDITIVGSVSHVNPT